MSWLRLFKRAAPGNPAAGYLRLHYNTAGPGAAAPAALCALDENGVSAMLAHFAILDYRLLKVTTLAAGVSWVPTNGCRAAYVECIGGGGQGGGAATSSANCSVGGGGGGGAYAAAWLSGAQIKNPTTYAIGAGGSGGAAGAAGGNGGDTTWDTNVIVAKGGTGGPVLAAGTTVVDQPGGAGGAQASCVGDVKIAGSIGGKGTRDAAAIGFSGDGGAAAVAGVVGALGKAVVGGGVAGVAVAVGAYVSGGSVAATTTTQQAGGAGQGGVIRVWEFA